jgi:outer membrane receptor for Fe3+-dicitrate
LGLEVFKGLIQSEALFAQVEMHIINAAFEGLSMWANDHDEAAARCEVGISSLRSWVRLSGYTQKSPTYIHSFSISFHFQPVSSHNSMNQIASLYNLYNFICTFSSWHIPLPF